MKKISFLLLVFLLILFITILTGCKSQFTGSVQRIIPPVNSSMPLKGTWLINKCFDKNFKPMGKNQKKFWAGEKVEFSDEAIKVGKLIWDNPCYKVKRVNTFDYFLYNYRLTAKKLGIESKEVSVYTVTSDAKFLYEFVEISENILIARIQDNFFFLIKSTDAIGDLLKNKIDNKNKNMQNNAQTYESTQSSGLVLGIRTLKNRDKNGVARYSYKTIWIAYDGKKLLPVLEAKDLIMPRMSGFWKVKVRTRKVNEYIEDILSTTVLTSGKLSKTPGKSNQISLKPINKNLNVYRSIQFAGNDYIGLGVTEERYKSGKMSVDSRFQFLPIDNLTNSKGIKISDLCGNDGLTYMKKARSSLLKSLNANYSIVEEKGIQEENYTLVRRTGHWFFSGRINYSRDSKKYYSDYDIKLIPSSKLVFYDTLYVPWTNIKDRVPYAADAYTSPTRNLAVIITQNSLYIYTIFGGELSKKPIKTMQLKNGDKVVMAEWCVGDYIDNWNEVIKKNASS